MNRKKKISQSGMYLIIFTTADNNKHNKKQLINTNQPIALIEAEHDTNKSEQKGTESARKLSAQLYLTLGAKVMLSWNVLQSVVLVNGAAGTLIDFIYEGGKNTPSLPFAIIIHFNEYQGPSFFNGKGSLCLQLQLLVILPVMTKGR
jgi:hypothetical protein